MNLSGVTFQGEQIVGDLPQLPAAMGDLLRQINGFIAFGGGFHFRGWSDEPRWHSLKEAWRGEQALCRLFSVLTPEDLPFGQDYLGDQFILRCDEVHRLHAESGELENLKVSLHSFLDEMSAGPVEFLQLHPLLRFQREGNQLEPGQLLSVYPPFVTEESANGVSLRAVSVADRLAFLSDFASQISGMERGEQFRVVMGE